MKLFRISSILCMVVAILFGVLLFWTSQSVQQKEENLSIIEKKLAQENETIRVLSVEWDYLNRPQRLEDLASAQLGMVSASGKEVVKNIGDIPEPALLEEGMVETVSMETKKPVSTDVVVKPAAAEKQNFEKLIQSLDQEGGSVE